MKFAVTDLFVVGTALDLVGGFLIAKGLLVSMPVLLLRSDTFWGGNPNVAVGAVEDRIDAQAGLLILGFGFILQAAGYVATLASEPVLHSSGDRAWTAVVLAVLTAALSFLAWHLARPRLVRRALLRLACIKTEDSGTTTMLDLPNLGRLAAYGRAWKGRQTKLTGSRQEQDADDVRLIFGSVETNSEDAEG